MLLLWMLTTQPETLDERAPLFDPGTTQLTTSIGPSAETMGWGLAQCIAADGSSGLTVGSGAVCPQDYVYVEYAVALVSADEALTDTDNYQGVGPNTSAALLPRHPTMGADPVQEARGFFGQVHLDLQRAGPDAQLAVRTTCLERLEVLPDHTVTDGRQGFLRVNSGTELGRLLFDDEAGTLYGVVPAEHFGGAQYSEAPLGQPTAVVDFVGDASTGLLVGSFVVEEDVHLSSLESWASDGPLPTCTSIVLANPMPLPEAPLFDPGTNQIRAGLGPAAPTHGYSFVTEEVVTTAAQGKTQGTYVKEWMTVMSKHSWLLAPMFFRDTDNYELYPTLNEDKSGEVEVASVLLSTKPTNKLDEALADYYDEVRRESRKANATRSLNRAVCLGPWEKTTVKGGATLGVYRVAGTPRAYVLRFDAEEGKVGAIFSVRDKGALSGGTYTEEHIGDVDAQAWMEAKSKGKEKNWTFFEGTYIDTDVRREAKKGEPSLELWATGEELPSCR